MPTLNLLYKKQYSINDSIQIIIPTLGEVVDDEDNYYGLLSALTATPYDLMVELDDAGIDFTTLNDYELFLYLFPGLRERDTSLIFGNLDLHKFQLGISEQNGLPVLIDSENDIVIDRAIHDRVATALRKIHHLEKNRRKPANKEAKEYLLERARAKRKRNMSRVRESQLEALIVALVNTEQCKYDFESIRDLSIYQFNESVQQTIKKENYEHLMAGIYAGTINAKEIKPEELNWLTNK